MIFVVVLRLPIDLGTRPVLYRDDLLISIKIYINRSSIYRIKSMMMDICDGVVRNNLTRKLRNINGVRSGKEVMDGSEIVFLF